MQEITIIIIEDLRLDLTYEFDQNFERKGFFNEKWPTTKRPSNIGSLMVRKGSLRRSILSSRDGSKLVFSSSVPYAEIHNEGGDIRRVSKKGKNYTIKMTQRQFIGESKETDDLVESAIDKHVPEYISNNLDNLFKESYNG